MKIKVILHSVLRDKLLPEAHGQTTMELAEGDTIGEIIKRLNLPSQAVCSINGSIQRDLNYMLCDGDEVRFFRAGAGG
jgi:sulfur carrier protein ThiS